jgi:hypothetical protein
MPLDKPLASITESDLAELISNGVREDRGLDYKRELAVDAPADRQEFVKDVTALANTIGGHLIYGMDEQDGVAARLVPLSQPDLDSEILRLDSCLRDNAAPRVPDVKFHPVAVNGGQVLVVRVPKSWAGPHMLKQGHSKFCGRASNGVYAMDVDEIRQAFLAADSLHEKVRKFRDVRLRTIKEGTAFHPANRPLKDNAAVVLHVCPLPLSRAQSWTFRELDRLGETHPAWFRLDCPMRRTSASHSMA